ncbi:hypothetical protein EDB92DRAFT_553518 [Lactarius akahatsu]|uniref:Uncharacterized protein n=1 Tax=Lactarius akahatsu TaxID=416441 RepID=A0AAD4L579_9AGAM|nr:hypothetical protein EDB92DRAFT_553518 [Lactarius akahatsu]
MATASTSKQRPSLGQPFASTQHTEALNVVELARTQFPQELIERHRTPTRTRPSQAPKRSTSQGVRQRKDRPKHARILSNYEQFNSTTLLLRAVEPIPAARERVRRSDRRRGRQIGRGSISLGQHASAADSPIVALGRGRRANIRTENRFGAGRLLE